MTKFKGVCPHPKRSGCWFAQINCAGKNYNLGTFDIEQGGEEAAAKAFDNAVYYAAKYRNEKRDFNFPADWASETVPAPTQVTTELLARVSADPLTAAWLTKIEARTRIEQSKSAKAATRLRKVEAMALIHEIRRALAFPDMTPQHPEALKKQINYVFGVELCIQTQITPVPCAPQPSASISAPGQSQPPANAPAPSPAPIGQKQPLRRLQSVLPAATLKPSNLAGRPRRFRPRTAQPVAAPSVSTLAESLPPDDPMPNKPDSAAPLPIKPARVFTQEGLTEMLSGPGEEQAAIDHRAPRRPPKGTAPGPVLF